MEMVINQKKYFFFFYIFIKRVFADETKYNWINEI